MDSSQARMNRLLQMRGEVKYQALLAEKQLSLVAETSLKTFFDPLLNDYNASENLRRQEISLQFNQFAFDDGVSDSHLTIFKPEVFKKSFERPLIRLSARPKEDGLDLCWEFNLETDNAFCWHVPVRYHDISQPDNLNRLKQFIDQKISDYCANSSQYICR
jgi:hypothetical protein